MKHKNFLYHLIACLTVFVWGGTFVNSKVLILHGMTPEEIFMVRFLIAYIAIWTVSPHRLWADNWRDEGLMLLLGITGGSLYFVSENWAVSISYVNNVSFIVCTAPLITTLLAIAFLKDVKATPSLILGSLLALAGVAIVIFNGHFVLKLNPVGDLLALNAAFCWAIYSLLMKNVTGRYGAVFITRKVFFYGLVTMIPFFAVHPWQFPLSGFLHPVIAGNLIFLGFIASFLCFFLWSWVNKKIGALKASNYIYLNPITTVVVSALVLSEPMTTLAFVGSAMILIGVFFANRH
ncbi:DMT family transporter [Prevotella sp. AGR2160]|uniref:DMT family transporter n=1 Tax=Prevotella sp. AGR2160 TaxID=1280674 RepID=UPI0003FBE207|nr:DMT family transporter [Prevotella sp. AGR2160]